MYRLTAMLNLALLGQLCCLLVHVNSISNTVNKAG